jgi:hypothetical protein
VREAADAKRIERLARELGRTVPPGTRMYLTGGATAVLEGWRESTVDIDVRFEPDTDAALERIRDLKEEMAINIELASPLDRGRPGDAPRSGREHPTLRHAASTAVQSGRGIFRLWAMCRGSLRA